MKLVVGLGNPGPRYRHTRHNLGFRVVEVMADRLNVACDRVAVEAETARARYAGASILLVKPQTYMNLSGRAVAALARKGGVHPSDVLVVVDDVHLLLGRLRLRAGGSAGGHNGLKSIIACLGTHDFPRLRMGIAGEDMPEGDRSDYVLSAFKAEERRSVEAMAASAADAAFCWLEHGIDEAMTRYNQSADKKGNSHAG